MKFNPIIGKFAKRVIGVLSAFLFTFSTIANSDQAEELVIWLKNGEKIQLNLSDTLKTTFSNGNVVIKSESAVFQWPMESIIKYTYNLPPSSIETTNATNDIKVSYLNDILTIETNSPKISVNLWGIDGILIDSWDLNIESKMSISFADYTPGIYVLELNGFTHKIIKR